MKDFKISSTDYINPKEIKISPELEAVQVMMPMSDEDYQRLKESISTYGKLRENLKAYQDKKGTFFLLSGWNRLKIATELSWKTVPIDVVEGLESEVDRKQYAISENLDRRQLTTEQKRELIKFFLKMNPEKSNLEISRKIGVSDKTVSSARKELESRSEIPNVEKKDSLGRKVGEKISRSEIPNVEKFNPKTAQNRSDKVSKHSSTPSKAEKIKALKIEKKRLESELKQIEREIKKLLGK